MIDQETIEECRKGNMLKFRDLVRETSPFAFSVVFRILGDEELAKEMTQDTMVAVWKNLGRIRSAGAFKTWLYRVAVNKCYDHLRRTKKNPEIRTDDKTWDLIANHISSDHSSDLENRETAMIIGKLSEKLSPRQKMIFILGDIEQMSGREISEITGMSPRNVKANLHYARKKIGEMIKQYI